jgi:hypothetical protein
LGEHEHFKAALPLLDQAGGYKYTCVSCFSPPFPPSISTFAERTWLQLPLCVHTIYTMDSLPKQEYRIRDLPTKSVTLFPTRAQIVREIKDVTLRVRLPLSPHQPLH